MSGVWQQVEFGSPTKFLENLAKTYGAEGGHYPHPAPPWFESYLEWYNEIRNKGQALNAESSFYSLKALDDHMLVRLDPAPSEDEDEDYEIERPASHDEKDSAPQST